MPSVTEPAASAERYNAWYRTGAAHWETAPGKQVILQGLRQCCDTRRPLRLLDVGCGTGDLLNQIQETVSAEWELYGIDFAATAIEQAQQHYPRSTLICADATQLATYVDGQFNILTCYGTWEHFADPQTALQSAGRVVALGGWLFAQLPTLGIYRTDVTEEGYYADIAPSVPGTAQQLQWNLRRETWARYLADAGFALLDDALPRRCSAQKPGVFYFAVRINA